MSRHRGIPIPIRRVHPSSVHRLDLISGWLPADTLDWPTSSVGREQKTALEFHACGGRETTRQTREGAEQHCSDAYESMT